jgi:hypothetical protein
VDIQCSYYNVKSARGTPQCCKILIYMWIYNVAIIMSNHPGELHNAVRFLSICGYTM